MASAISLSRARRSQHHVVAERSEQTAGGEVLMLVVSVRMVAANERHHVEVVDHAPLGHP